MHGFKKIILGNHILRKILFFYHILGYLSSFYYRGIFCENKMTKNKAKRSYLQRALSPLCCTRTSRKTSGRNEHFQLFRIQSRTDTSQKSERGVDQKCSPLTLTSFIPLFCSIFVLSWMPGRNFLHNSHTFQQNWPKMWETLEREWSWETPVVLQQRSFFKAKQTPNLSHYDKSARGT